MAKLKKTKNNLKIIMGKSKARQESQRQKDHRAELTLLSLLVHCESVEEKIAVCQELGVDQDEVILLEKKWKHVLKRYEEDRNKAIGDNIVNIFEQFSKEKTDNDPT